jgi:hypothetical protein
LLAVESGPVRHIRIWWRFAHPVATEGTIRYFDVSETEEAWAWLEEA